MSVMLISKIRNLKSILMILIVGVLPFTIDYIIERMIAKDIKFNDLFLSTGGQHPPIVKMFLSKKINFETLIILDDILKFTKKLNKDITEKVLWPKLFDRMKRYRPFLSYNITKYKISLRDKLKEI